MPLHWGASGHQIGNITDDVPIQLLATDWCRTESVCACMIGCVLELFERLCACYACAGMRSWRVSVLGGYGGKEDDPAQLTVSHAGQNNTITLLLTRTWHTSHLLPPRPTHRLTHACTWADILEKHTFTPTSHAHTHALFLQSYTPWEMFQMPHCVLLCYGSFEASPSFI